MFEFFLNPAFLAVGGSLVSAPIIIHLINRMKFRRVRWAAMEFLLKSQKRNRRRLIIEQLILLLLRCLLVLLTVLLVARFIGFNFSEFFQAQSSTLHIIVLDDSPSMGDQWAADGETKTAFGQAKEMILKKIVQPAFRTPSSQHIILLQMSDLDTVLHDQPLSEQTRDELQSTLDELSVSNLRGEASLSIDKARELFDSHSESQRYLHVVSDFRTREWSDAERSGLQRALSGLEASGIHVRLIDAAHPVRNELQRTPPYHENLGIVAVRPETRLVAKDLPIEFEVEVRNFSLIEYKNVRIAVKVNGGERAEGSVTFANLPPGSHKQKFQLVFDKTGFNQVTANLDPEEAGLKIDNTHYTVVEVRNQVPVLVVDGDLITTKLHEGDLFYFQNIFSSTRGYQIVPRDARELEQPNLDQYSSIFLINLRELSDKAIQNVEAYVRNGGGVAIFLGPRVRDVKLYNEKLHARGKGFFPVPLADLPEPRANDKDMEGTMRLFPREVSHPLTDALRGVHPEFLKHLTIRRYWPINRKEWKPEPGVVEPLVMLPNQRSVREYAEEAKTFLKELEGLIAQREQEKYHPGLRFHGQAIRETLTAERPLADLGSALEALLSDKGVEKDPQRPNLLEMWGQQKLLDLRGRLTAFRETVQYGDPLVVAKNHGRGRVVAFLTSFGSAPRPKEDNPNLPWGWHNWARVEGVATYPMLILETQKHLAGGGSENSLTLGSAVNVQVESARYAQKIRRMFQPEAPEENKGDDGKASNLQDRGEQIGAISGGQLTFRFEEADRPGVYLFELTQVGDENNPNTRTETRAFVYNIDPEEGDLRRASLDDLERASGGAPVENLDTRDPDSFSMQKSLSESPWFYLVFLIVLVLEQALAVHLSFHAKGGEAS